MLVVPSNPVPFIAVKTVDGMHAARSSRGWMIALFLFLIGTLQARLEGTEIDFPASSPTEAIVVSSDEASQSDSGAYRVYHFKGNCRIKQGTFQSRSDEAVLWVDQTRQPGSEQPVKVILYLDGNVAASWNAMGQMPQQIRDDHWMGRLYSFHSIDARPSRWVEQTITPQLNWNLENPNNALVTPAQFQSPASSSSTSTLQPPTTLALPETLPTPQRLSPQEGRFVPDTNNPYGGMAFGADGEPIQNIPSQNKPDPSTIPPTTTTVLQPADPIVPIAGRNFKMSGRTGGAAQFEWSKRPDKGDSVATVTGGFRIRIEGVQARMNDGSTMDFGTVQLEADRAVIWTRDFLGLFEKSIDGEPLEIYLEGNIIFQQGQRTVYADRMYYNVQSDYGMILSAEILTPVPQYEGLLRLKADVVQQRSKQSFLAYDAALTSSRLGVPRYWLQTGKVELSDQRKESFDPITGRMTPLATPGGTDMEADARNNFVYLGGIPVFYWPVLSSNVQRPSFYLTGAKVKNDRIFGTQAMLDWDLYQLLGINGPNGTDWTLSTDYLSKRGFALGTNFIYDRPDGILPGPTAGYFDFWGLKDSGTDTLGLDRIGLTPEETTRGRALFRHRKYLSPDLEFTAEGGWISDRNFLEQYFEREWDQEKDFSTALRLRRYADNRMLDVWGQARVNDFFTETEWLPRVDHYWLGQSLFDRLTFYAHSSIGYAHQRVASTPVNAADLTKFQLQGGEVDAEGLRAVTRQELDLPFNMGAVKVVPYLSGEASHWGEDATGNSLDRLTGQAGIRTSLPLTSINTRIESRLLNISGIAHKMNFHTDLFYADSNKNIDQLPLYDPLDDNSQEHFRRRLVFNTFAGALPAQSEYRGYALRQGLQRFVTGPTEIMDDQLQYRLGLNQRWQTKRGPENRQRITDLVEFDVDLILFPKADRDNFGEEIGATTYDFRYHIGDRVTLLSEGYYDIFSRGLKMTSIGTMISRPGRGDWYTGLTSIEGPVSSLVASTTLNYRMNEKWIANFGTAVDLGKTGNIGQTIALTHIGESFLTKVGLNVDSGRDNASFVFSFEPRFLNSRRLGALGGELIPPASLYGLE